MKRYEVAIKILDDTYIDNLIVSLVRQGHEAYYNEDVPCVCFTATEEEITEIKVEVIK